MMWLRNPSEEVEVKLHWLQKCDFSPVCFLIMWILRWIEVVHIDCNGVVFLQCVSKCAFWDDQLDLLSRCTVRTCGVYPQCEWVCGSPKRLFVWMTCCTVDSCISCLHCVFAYVAKGIFCLQTSLDIDHRIPERSSFWTEPLPCPFGWWLSWIWGNPIQYSATFTFRRSRAVNS